MAKSLAQFVGDIRAYIGKGKVKAARKTFDKAVKVGHKGPALEEATLELLLAEGARDDAARQIRKIAQDAEARLPAAVKHVEAYLRKVKDDHVVRDTLWETALAHGDTEIALKHLTALVQANGLDGNERAKALLARKDAAGATGIFLLASLGAVQTDRIKLADKMLANDTASRHLEACVQTLHAHGHADGPIHYVMAQLAQRAGDQEAFLDHASKSFEERPDDVWTWTTTNVGTADRLEIALRNDSLKHLIEAAEGAKDAEIVGVANRSSGETPTARTLRGLALLMTKKVPNACRILEKLVAEHADVAPPLVALMERQAEAWPGAREVHGAIVGAALAHDGERVRGAAARLLEVPPGERGDAWARVAPRLLSSAPDHDELREHMGLFHIGKGDDAAAAELLEDKTHLETAKRWAQAGSVGPPVLLAAAELAEKHEQIAQHAEWLLRAAGDNPALLSELGAKLSGSTVSADTALKSARTLLDQKQQKEAAEILSRLPLDADTGKLADALLRERGLLDDRGFQTVSFRCALSLGDANRARRLFKSVDANVQALSREAAAHTAPGRVLAEVLIGMGKGEVAVQLLEARRAAGDDAKSLLPLADQLLKTAPQLAMGRLVRAKLLQALQREGDAVRDLRAIPIKAAEVDEAFELLGKMKEGEAGGDAALGRADIHIGKQAFPQAVRELVGSQAPAPDRLQRLDAITRAKPDLDAGHKARADTLLEVGRVPEAAETALKRFHCSDSNPTAVANDLEDIVKEALKADDIPTAGAVLEQLPEHVSDGAERSIAVIGDDQRPPMLILRSKMLLQLGRTGEAVSTLDSLVRSDDKSRPPAAEALQAIVESGQARPEADFALAHAFDAMQRTSEALHALSRLYDDDVTSKENVVKAAQSLVVRQDDPDVRLFLGRVCLDMRKPREATEHAIHARRLRPGARRDCVEVLRKALDQDAFAPQTHFALAEAHLAGDEADDAVRHFRASVEVDRERSRSAIAAMEEAAPRSKHPALLWLAVGTTYAEFLKDHQHAVEAYSKGLEASPTTELRVPLLLGRGDAYAALREDDRAFDDFDEASQHDLLERRYYEFLRARHRKRVLEAAEAARGKAMKSFAHAAEAVGRFVKLGRANDAVQVAQAALAREPDGLGPRYLVGVALHAAGRYDAAAQVLEAVRASSGADTEVGRAARMLLAESYLDNGDRQHARACLTEIESVDAAYPGLKARRAALAPPADDPHAPPPLFARPDFPRPTE